MTGLLGYVVIEWNQASRQPDVIGDLCHSMDEAEELKTIYEDVKPIARGEPYTIAEVIDIEGDA